MRVVGLGAEGRLFKNKNKSVEFWTGENMGVGHCGVLSDFLVELMRPCYKEFRHSRICVPQMTDSMKNFKEGWKPQQVSLALLLYFALLRNSALGFSSGL